LGRHFRDPAAHQICATDGDSQQPVTSALVEGVSPAAVELGAPRELGDAHLGDPVWRQARARKPVRQEALSSEGVAD